MGRHFDRKPTFTALMAAERTTLKAPSPHDDAIKCSTHMRVRRSVKTLEDGKLVIEILKGES